MDILDQPVLYLDFQASGASPAYGNLMEMGWAFGSPAGTSVQVNSVLFKQPADELVPDRIYKITGIDPDELELGEDSEQMFASMLGQLEDETGIEAEAVAPPPCIIHYARYELGFLRELLPEDTSCWPFEIFCTFEIARRLYPDIRTRGLHGLAGYLGFPLQGLKRSADHIDATVKIWAVMASTLRKDYGIQTYENLRVWLDTTPVPKAGKKVYSLPREKRLGLPDVPGVYQFLDAKGGLLYVGKASSLKKRVNSWFRGKKSKGGRLNEMLTMVHDLRWQETCHGIEACLVESDLIKSAAPPYNRALTAGERKLGWLSKDGVLCSREEAWIGPFRSLHRPALVSQILLTEKLLAGEETELVADFLRHEQWFAGVETLMSAVGSGPLTLTDWRRFLFKLWRWRREIEELEDEVIDDEEQEDNDDLEEIDEDEQEEEPDAEDWETDDVVEWLEGQLVGFVNQCQRSRWFLRLSSSVVLVKDPDQGKGWLQIEIREGQMKCSSKNRKPRVVPWPNENPSRQERRQWFDVSCWDRLSVLIGELRRTCNRGGIVWIYLQKDKPISGHQLLEWMNL